jgi:hypothetical protein
MATKNGLVLFLVINETAIFSPAGAAEEAAADAAADDAAAEGAAADEDDALDEEPELHAARVTVSTPATAMAVTARPRVKRFDMWIPFEGGWCDPKAISHVYAHAAGFGDRGPTLIPNRYGPSTGRCCLEARPS